MQNLHNSLLLEDAGVLQTWPISQVLAEKSCRHACNKIEKNNEDVPEERFANAFVMRLLPKIEYLGSFARQ